MQLQAQLNFILSNQLSDVFLMSGDYDWLKNNIFHEGEFYVGMKFNHLGYNYVVEEISSFNPQSDYVSWSDSDDDNYFGKPSKTNFDIYIKCKKII
ncbi:hypothetical protein [Sphingobacterium paramultivorum]|uniref:hypothetical protein n=1 Tax=Sphingobacterium paramultivorum TaxID=2886510 RepID=UPI00129C30E0|nr:hypothetical protein [Sphingobacterium paramultivorum]